MVFQPCLGLLCFQPYPGLFGHIMVESTGDRVDRDPVDCHATWDHASHYGDQSRACPLCPPDGGLVRRSLSGCTAQSGLAAAAVRKPTVAQYTRYFRYLGVAAFAQDCGSYGEAPRHEMIAMLGNFPEKGGSMSERRVRKSLKRHNLSSASFPKRLLLGRVASSSCSLALTLLP